MNDDPAKRAWQASVEIGGALPLDEVRKGADKFYRTIRRRNAIEYAACVFVVVAFSANVFILPHVLQRIGSALIVLATFYVGWQLHRRGSAETPEKAGTMPIAAFARAQLVRQRDALRSIFWWYLLPFMPGLATAVAGGFAMRAGEPGGIARGLVVCSAMLGAFVGIWWLNQIGARKLQKRIDEIDALTGGDA